MKRPSEQLRQDALAIWQAGIDAVRSDRLINENLCCDNNHLYIGDDQITLDEIRRIVVVGAGKAGAGMAAGLEAALGERIAHEKQLSGWVNVPADCVRDLKHITLHAARPAGVNEPTPEGTRGAEEILRLVSSLKADDLCLCLLSGGGSALLPAPVAGVTLADKQEITKHLSAAGANIQQLNTVRKQLSRIKGGGLARACSAGRLVTLAISDVIGDPLDTIASGPTVEDFSTPQDALSVLEEFHARDAGISQTVFDYLQNAVQQSTTHAKPTCRVNNLVIGNNAIAVDAAGMEAERRGYSHAMVAASELEGPAEDIGRHLANMALRMRNQEGPDCLITGGEPTVKLVDESRRGLGGRNQQLVLAALESMIENDDRTKTLEGIVMLSGGTDGEDGPTDAAGAIIDEETLHAMQQHQLDASDYLRRNDAYSFFEPLGGLIKTGPTHTNVCDVRVVVVDRIETRSPDGKK